MALKPGAGLLFVVLSVWVLAMSLSCRGGGEGAGTASSGWRFFDFSPGNHWEYELKGAGTLGGQGSYVLDAEAGQGTVVLKWEVSYKEGGSEPLHITSSDQVKSPDEAQFILGLLPPAGSAVEVVSRTLLAPPRYIQLMGRRWQVGKSWETTLKGETVRFFVVSPCSYAGVEGVLGRWSKNDQILLEVCASSSQPMPLMARDYGTDGAESQATLVSLRQQ